MHHRIDNYPAREELQSEYGKTDQSYRPLSEVPSGAAVKYNEYKLHHWHQEAHIYGTNPQTDQKPEMY